MAFIHKRPIGYSRLIVENRRYSRQSIHVKSSGVSPGHGGLGGYTHVLMFGTPSTWLQVKDSMRFILKTCFFACLFIAHDHIGVASVARVTASA